MKSAKALAALALASAAGASPVPEPRDICIGVNVIVDLLKGLPIAASFCIALLEVPPVTVTKATTLLQPTTITETITSTITPTVTAQTTLTETSTTCMVGQQKRDHAGYYPSPAYPTPQAPAPYSAPQVPEPGYTPPTVPGPLSGFPLVQVILGCKCLGLPAPTVTSLTTITETTTATVTSSVLETAAPTTVTEIATSTSVVHACPAPTPCGNQGLQWEYLINTSGDSTDVGYSRFVPESYKGKSNRYAGVTNTIGGINDPGTKPSTIYGSSLTLPARYYILNHRGYIYAQQTGTYTFSISGVDDALYIWVGDMAYSGWTAANANSKTAIGLGAPGPGKGSFTVELEEGQYYPVRMVFAQAQGASVFSVQMTSPDGKVFLGADSGASPYLVQYSCDGTSAPKFAEWADEK